MSKLWATWFNLWAAGVVVFGLVLAGGAIPAFDAATRMIMDGLKGPGPQELTPLVRFSLGVCGPVSMGWGIGLFGVIRVTSMIDAEPRRILWTIFSLGVFTWFAIDSCLSVATGFWRNAIPNCVMMATYLIPLFGSGVLAGGSRR